MEQAVLFFAKFMQYSFDNCKSSALLSTTRNKNKAEKKSTLLWFSTYYINYYNGFQKHYKELSFCREKSTCFQFLSNFVVWA